MHFRALKHGDEIIGPDEYNALAGECVHEALAEKALVAGCSEVFFKIKSNIFLDTLILKLLYKFIKIDNFRGELSDVAAKKTALAGCIYRQPHG